MNKDSDAQKVNQLRKHKIIATGLFLLMVAVYILSTWWLKTHHVTWLPYIKAFAEAAMVGALADWFAVTALFHHPLGIPIPHTNLIENRKKSIGNNLGGFVVSNFLNSHTIKPYIQKLDISILLLHWLKNEKNIALLISETSKLIKNVLAKADDATITQFITKKSTELLQNIHLNNILASGLDIIVKRGDHFRILDYILDKLSTYVINNEDMIRERVKKESHFLIPGFVDNMIAAKITNGLSNYISEIKNNAHHKIRNDINIQLSFFIEDLRKNPTWEQELNEIKNSILQEAQIQQYASSIWKYIQSGIINDLNSNTSHIQIYFYKIIRELSANLEEDPNMQDKINHWARYNIYRFVLRNAKKAGTLISNTVGNWKGKELSNKLELEVGKDLQYIRINGTLVGGLVGLLIYTITQLI